MKLDEFLEKLQDIKMECGEDVEVVMADDVSVVEPVCLDYRGVKKVIITDEK